MQWSFFEDASGFTGHADAVHVPANESELIALLCTASNTGTPVTLAGAGTGVTGGRVPQGGWVISLARFDRLEIGNGEARCGAGVLLKDLQAAALRTGQFYAPDPTENSASLGGTLATNASGSRSFRYGPTRKHVLGVRAVFMDGSAAEFADGDPLPFAVPDVRQSATAKNTAGYALRRGMDWLDLLTGSEGTLAVLTEARLRLLPVPRELLTGVVFFGSDAAALDAVDAWRARPRLRMLEYMDAPSLALLRPSYPEISPDAAAALIVEEEIEDESALDEWVEMTPEDSWFAAGDRDRERLRRFRHALPEAVNSTVRSRGLLKMGTDFAVPMAENRAMLAFYRERLEAEFAGQYVIFGHIGDAHLHVNLLPRSGGEADHARTLIDAFAMEAVRRGGTVSAEHGLGKRKAHLLEMQFTAAEIEDMKAVKHRLDPQWLLGRGTLFRLT